MNKKQILITIIAGSIVVSGAVAYSLLSGKTVLTEVIAESKNGDKKVIAFEDNDVVEIKVAKDITDEYIKEIKALVKSKKIHKARRVASRFSRYETSTNETMIMKFYINE